MTWQLRQKARVFLAGTLWGSLFGVVITLSLQEQYAIAYQKPSEIPSKEGNSDLLERKCKQVGYPSLDNIRVTSSYVSAFSPFLRTSLWVMEYVSHDNEASSPVGTRSKSSFYKDPDIIDTFRASNTDYRDGAELGLSRGHLAPAQMHTQTQKEMDETFNLSLNIVPQLMSTNGCDWFRLEKMVKNLSKKYNETWIVTGPAFIPNEYGNESENQKQKVWKTEFTLIGEKRVAVPTHLFKVVLGKQASLGSKYHCAAFLLPNSPIPDELPMTKYQIDVEELEGLTGLRFFPELRYTDAQRNSIEKGHPLALSTFQSPVKWKDMCKESVCEGGYASFSKMYRHLSKMQSAKSIVELDELWSEAQALGYATRLKKDYETLKDAMLETSQDMQS